jgi:large subunit ribosomal protein L30
MAAKVKITQIQSEIRCLIKQKRTLEALGLRGVHKSVVKEQNPTLTGMLRVVNHLVKVEEAK